MSAIDVHSRDIETESYYQFRDASIAASARWILHQEHACPPIGIMDHTHPEDTNFGIEGEMIYLLGLDHKTNKSIADIACGNGRLISRLAELGYPGELTGINYPGEAFDAAEMQLSNHKNVHFIESDARNLCLPEDENGERLPIPDNSFDMVMSNFTLYHVAGWEKALDEFYRVLKPGGQLLIATRNEDHQAKLWIFAQEIATEIERKLKSGKMVLQELFELPFDGEERPTTPNLTKSRKAKIIAPQSFYSHFNLDTARKAPEGKFEYQFSFRQDGYSHLHAKDWTDYRTAALYLFNAYSAQINGTQYLLQRGGLAFEESIDRIIMPEFFKEIKENGVFLEFIEQGFDVWEKPVLKKVNHKLAS